MATVKVTSRFKILELIDRFVDDATAKDLGRTVVNKAKEMLETGQSPVEGYGRFDKYSQRYTDQIKGASKARVKAAVVKAVSGAKKPVKKAVAKKAKAKAQSIEQKTGKKVRPVNLWLTGAMIDKGFDFRLGSKDTIEVGMVKGSEERKRIAAYHNSGTDNMPQRKLVPGEGENWAITIMRGIRDVYGKRLADLIRQSNKKS